MIVFKHIAKLQAHLQQQGTNIGFVPTMGALHAGHISLISRAKQDGGLVVCSIFVNPTQFNDPADFEKYPSSLPQDMEMLAEAGCDVLFAPSVAEMYPGGAAATISYDFGYVETLLEGAHRPGHFKGVGQVVARLLDIVKPHTMYLGQKDYQQCMVLTQLVTMPGVHPAKVAIVPTLREADGLAMSSRNRRLTEPQRVIAALIYQCLVSIQAKKDSGNFTVVQKECNDILKAKGFEPDYIAIADAETLAPLENYDATRPMVALIAAKIGEIRLIDNMVL
jgi:pantoate--beta-alanine ligase